MTKTKTKAKAAAKLAANRGYKVDYEDDIPLEALPPEPEKPPPCANTSMVLDMEGYGGEVASALIVNGLRAYLSVVNKGINLVACDRSHTAFIPVKIAACVVALDIKKDDAKSLNEAKGVVAFLIGGAEACTSYYLPISEYLSKAKDRGESGLRLDLKEHAKWLEKYEGHAGAKRTFERLMG
jgi:hypothetical protein